MNKFLLPALLIVLMACNSRNKLNTNEQNLKAQIIAEEGKKKEAVSQTDLNVSAVAGNFSPGMRFLEDRSVDEQHPPVHLDIIRAKNDVKALLLSDVASSIRYIKLETPPDPQLLYIHPELNSLLPAVVSDDKCILVQGIFGISRFDLNGRFREVIWKNESGISISQKYASWSPNELLGITPDNPVSLRDGNIYARFQDGDNRQVRILKKEIKEGPVLKNPVGETSSNPSFGGSTLFSLTGKSMSRNIPLIYGITENSWAGVDNTFEAASSGNLLVLYDTGGDTLCTFSNTNRIENWSSPFARAGEPHTYYYGNRLTVMEQYTDTIFRLIPPNRLLPVYKLDFGKNKVTFDEGMDTKSDLSQKLMKYSVFETEDQLFVQYTRNLASTRNLRNKAVSFYSAIFSKKENRLYTLPQESSRPVKLSNDLDGGIPFWPQFVTPKGDMMMLVTGKQMKTYIDSEEFQKKAIPGSERDALLKMQQETTDKDIIIVVAN